jgi:hypothetical protein
MVRTRSSVQSRFWAPVRIRKQHHVTRSDDFVRVHGLQARELQFPQEQEAHHQPIGDGEVLQVVQEAHRTQRDQEITNPDIPLFFTGGSYSGSTAVSKTARVGSIPTPPANKGH